MNECLKFHLPINPHPTLIVLSLPHSSYMHSIDCVHLFIDYVNSSIDYGNTYANYGNTSVDYTNFFVDSATKSNVCANMQP
jgi:hypothetical protein